VDSVHVAQERNVWPAFATTVMGFIKCGGFLDDLRHY
jgi:hypothetical protein